MYVTRPLSLYLRDESALSLPPPEGPNSGYLVISDDDEESEAPLMSGNLFRPIIKRLPFFQNKDFKIQETYEYEPPTKVLFIPVLNRPLSDNCYYVLLKDMWNKGYAATSSNEITRCCGGSCIKDVLPLPFNPFNPYQQFEIIMHQQPYVRFHAESMASDGNPPRYLRRQWRPYIDVHAYRRPLHEALGLNSSLRAQLPPYSFSSSLDHSEPVVVGNWYCPFMFVWERSTMSRPTFYEMTLEQKWVRVFSTENDNGTIEQKRVHVEVDVETEVARIAGKNDAFRDEGDVASGFVWFIGSDRGREERVGLSMAIMERMKWEQERVGWVGGTNGIEKLERVEEFEGSGTWSKFSCYILVESFVLKRKDKNLVITCDFNHTHQVRCKWE